MMDCSQNRPVDTGRVRRGWDKLRVALTHMKRIASEKLLCSAGSSAQGSVMTQRAGMGVERRLKREKICILMADSHCCTAERNTTL